MNKILSYSWLSLIIACNCYVLTQLSWTQENLSYFSVLHQQWILTAWGILTAAYFLVYTRQCFQNTRFHSYDILLYLSTFGMMLSVIIPYQPAVYPMLADIHIVLSYVSTVIYAGVLMLWHYHLFFYYPKRFQKNMPLFVLICIFCLLMYATYGCVNTLMETCFSAGISVLLTWNVFD